jgi:tRNA-modifying protein YgfZ
MLFPKNPEETELTSLRLHSLSDSGLIRFSGEDAPAFLHGQLSCDVNALTSNASTYGSYCTPKGRVLATFLLWRSEQRFFMQLPSSLREPIRKRLSMFVLRSRVRAEDVTEAFALFGLSGEGAPELLVHVFGEAPESVHEVKDRDGTVLIKLPVDRFEVAVPVEKAAAVAGKLRQQAAPAAPHEWDLLDIRAGIPVITPATQEEFVPQMVNLDLIGGVSYTKGCYPGQEIVARMHYLGRLKQRMYRARVESEMAPQLGGKLYSAETGEQSCGTIVNAAPAPEGGHEVLAVIQMTSAETGDVRWKALDGPLLEISSLPYPLN